MGCPDGVKFTCRPFCRIPCIFGLHSVTIGVPIPISFMKNIRVFVCVIFALCFPGLVAAQVSADARIALEAEAQLDRAYYDEEKRKGDYKITDCKADDGKASSHRGVSRRKDIQKRKEKYQLFTQLLLDEAPAVFLYYPQYYWAVSQKVEGIDLSDFSNSSDRFNSSSNWKIRRKFF